MPTFWTEPHIYIYHIISYYIILYCIVLYYIILYYTILYYLISYHIILYYIVGDIDPHDIPPLSPLYPISGWLKLKPCKFRF